MCKFTQDKMQTEAHAHSIDFRYSSFTLQYVQMRINTHTTRKKLILLKQKQIIDYSTYWITHIGSLHRAIYKNTRILMCLPRHIKYSGRLMMIVCVMCIGQWSFDT